MRSDHLWKASTLEEWQRFMAHDIESISRRAAYGIVRGLLKGRPSFAEIGFGNCIDFKVAWKPWHDKGLLAYRGFDLSEDFCQFARAEYPAYYFEQSDFAGLCRFPRADIVYVRHVFEHAPPDEYKAWIRGALRFAGKAAVIVWFLAPQEYEHLDYPEAWNNTYAREEVWEVIRSEGFEGDIAELSAADHIYRLHRV